MRDDSSSTTRRNLMAGAVGLAALAGLAELGAAGEARANDYGDMTDQEKANMKVVADFCKAFNDPKPDADKIFSYMTEDGAWRQGPRPLMVGRAAVTQRFREVLKDGARFDLKIIDTFVRGNYLAHTRIDTRSVAGGPYTPAPGPIAGIFTFKNGKIAEWYELFFPRPS